MTQSEIDTLVNARYRLDAEIGRGGMGVVYRAHDTLLERDVAVKVLSVTDPGTEARVRLLNEARAVAQLDHPNIVAVYDAGESDGTPFIVMQLIEGPSLHECRPATLKEVLDVAHQICAALEHAHSHNIVHRDLKPENVLLASDGTAKLVDFGLARTAASRLTAEGGPVGTVFYLAPEQVLGGAVDGRVDLYAFGVMLYELTTGRLPFTGDDPLAVISQHLHAPVDPPSTHNPEIVQWPALDELVVQLLSKQPDDRPASAAKVGRRLANLTRPKLPAEYRVERPNNLPAQATPFIGREAQLTVLREELTRPEVRLQTLTGAGGTGKTRLALQVAADLLDHFQDGVFFVALAPIRDPALVIPTVAQTLGVREGKAGSQLISLGDYLRDKQMLLVLDSFEHVTSAAPVIGKLLAAAPRLKVLATSRALLHVYGEHDFPVPPLAVPGPNESPSLEDLAGYEAIELFIQRARAVTAGFRLSAENAPAVVEICARLDGLPLAIELAAARVRLLPPQTMLSRLGRRLQLLKDGPRDLPARQRTLRATIDWSFDLLDANDKALFRRLSVFVGGCTLEAAEVVCNFSDNLDVLSGLGALVDQSLLKPSDAYGEPRFSMLETIREFALEKLAAIEETDIARRRHADFFLDLAEQAEPRMEGPEQETWLNRLEVEHENFRAALSWAGENEQVYLGMRLAAALGLFWFMRGHLTEGRERLVWVLSRERENQDPRLRARCLDRAGFLARYQGDFDEAYSLIKESLKICRELADPHRIADSLSNLGFVYLHKGSFSEARKLYEEALATNRELGNAQGVADTLSHLALIAFYQGDSKTARDLDGESLEIWRELEDPVGVAWALHKLGNVVFHEGDLADARGHFRESLVTAFKVGFKLGIANSLEGLASVAAAKGQSRRALELAGAAATLRQEIGLPQPPAGKALFERTLVPARQALAPDEADAAWECGQAMALQDAINRALGPLTSVDSLAAIALR